MVPLKMVIFHCYVSSPEGISLVLLVDYSTFTERPSARPPPPGPPLPWRSAQSQGVGRVLGTQARNQNAFPVGKTTNLVNLWLIYG